MAAALDKAGEIEIEMVAPWLFRRYALVVPWQRVGFGPVDKLLPANT